MGSVCRSNWPCRGPEVTRMRGKALAAATSAVALAEEATLNSVLDCPLHSTTSPTSTSSRVAQEAASSQAVICAGAAEAGWGGKRSLKKPLASAVAVALGRPVKEAVTEAPGEVQPQTGMGLPR